MSRNFGRHVRSLRRARGMTQDVLAERSTLSTDTIRRLEHGSFSPSLETLRKLCVGLDLMLSTLFESFELGARNESRELVDLLATRTPRELALATTVLRSPFDELDAIAAPVPTDARDRAGSLPASARSCPGLRRPRSGYLRRAHVREGPPGHLVLVRCAEVLPPDL